MPLPDISNLTSLTNLANGIPDLANLKLDNVNINIKVEGPYAVAIEELAKTIREISAGQPAEIKAELWKQYLDAITPWNNLGTTLVHALLDPITKAIQDALNKRLNITTVNTASTTPVK